MYTISNQPDDEHPPEYIEQVDDLYAYEEEASKLRGSYRKNERERHLNLFNPSNKQFEILCIRGGND